MSDTKEFPTAALASITTGVLLCDFSTMHKAAEFLMGHPIWTHHFADKELWKLMRATAITQHPNLPVEIGQHITKDNYLSYVAEIEGAFGKTLTIKRGSALTAMLPTDGIPDNLKDKTIMVSHD